MKIVTRIEPCAKPEHMKLAHIYNKQLHDLVNQITPDKMEGLLKVLITGLEFYRDGLSLGLAETLGETESVLLDLVQTALYEYNEYQIERERMIKYDPKIDSPNYKIANTGKLLDKYSTEASKHWKNFWFILQELFLEE